MLLEYIRVLIVSYFSDGSIYTSNRLRTLSADKVALYFSLSRPEAGFFNGSNNVFDLLACFYTAIVASPSRALTYDASPGRRYC